MSNLCKTELCNTVESNIGSLSSSNRASDILLASVSLDKIEEDRVSSVQFDALPDANTVQNGHIAYIEDANVPVIASNDSWIGLDGRTVGSFVENQLLSWGYNRCGRIGDGLAGGNRCSPVREICNATDWCQVSAGWSASAAVKTSGELWLWGFNCCGQLGDGSQISKCSPVREICSATDWCQVSAGRLQVAAVKTSGQLWAWGRNNCGQLGDGSVSSKCSPVRERSSSTDWCQVSAGYYSTAAVKTTGELWAWGRNNNGQLGDGTVTDKCSPVREISSSTDWCQVSGGGRYHTSAIKTSGQIWSWGSNSCGRLGDGTVTDKCSPVREISSSTDWCQVSAGVCHTTAVKTSGQIWSWGRNDAGQFGDGSINTCVCSPVREISSSTDWCQVSTMLGHTLAIKTSGQLWGWGCNGNTQLGTGNNTSSTSPVREISSSTGWCQVSASSISSAGINLKLCICR